MNCKYQLSSHQAVQIYNSSIWRKWTSKQIVDFQLFQECLCLPMTLFKRCLSEICNRQVYTHEIARDYLIDEIYKKSTIPQFENFLNSLPINQKEDLIKLINYDGN